MKGEVCRGTHILLAIGRVKRRAGEAVPRPKLPYEPVDGLAAGPMIKSSDKWRVTSDQPTGKGRRWKGGQGEILRWWSG